jgi:ATP-dependent Clp protease ATP-binding subunit ClpA
VLTSNIGAEFIDRMANIGFGHGSSDEAAQYEQVKEKVLAALKDRFRPEFLNRLDEIVIFDVLGKDALARIVENQVRDVIARLSGKRITLTIAPDVRTWLAGIGHNPQYGARPLKRAIQDKILTPIASYMVSQGIMEGGTVNVSMKGDAPHFELKKAPAKRARKERKEVAV